MANYTNPDISALPTWKEVVYLDNRCAIFTCNGNPEGVIIANTGSLALSDDGNVYKKTTDIVATGWINLSGGGGGGGADTDLGNLTPTVINQDLVPVSDNTFSLGSAVLRWVNLFLSGFLRISGTAVDLFHTPAGSDVPTKINIPTFDPGGFGQIVAMGIGDIPGNRRVMSLFDARTIPHDATLAIFSPSETQIIGFSWDGTDNLGFVKATNGKVGLQGRIFIGLPATAPADGDITTSFGTMRLDEAANQLSIRVRYSDGTLHTGVVNLI